jgi:hypothetical protein
LNITDEQIYPSLNCPKYVNNDYHPLYTCNLASETAILACCSLLLTMINIICIIIMALIILRIKEVVPLYQSNKDIANFFHHDVRVARDYNKTLHEGDFHPIDFPTSTRHENNLTQTIINRWKTFKSSPSNRHHDQPQQSSSSMILNFESANHKTNLAPNDMESRRKLFRLQTFAKEYDLDLLNKDDYDLINCDSREKVHFLVSDLIDMCQEIPSVFVDLYRLQPLGTQSSSTGKEHLSFYQEIIELLPPKWYQLFLYERQRRLITAWPLPFHRSYSMRSRPLETCAPSTSEPFDRNLHESLRRQNKKHRPRLNRQNSVPESNISSTRTRQETELPVKGTRFRIAKPATEMIRNESILI